MNTIDEVIAACPHQLEPCYQSKARAIDQRLRTGIPYTALGGKPIRCCKTLLRFKIGLSFRLIYQITKGGYTPCALITRQRLDRELKRRRPSLPMLADQRKQNL
ncbi:hypothetical protein HG264_01120 [Pseudomonas sp. gcc21]|uniref:ParE family toxin-like protein n=1 Tax=Pseudomonas sp. gcc21 TaxID=2726989 RepID=UPI00145109B7|nr:hypothetical protein [Pseudomonas sp. gcc21]QJD57605.1 hypothetical protein HG264_01120 [Pseudomonas sp. gcc21]